MAHFVILFSSVREAMKEGPWVGSLTYQVSLGTILTSAVYKVYKLLGALRAIRRVSGLYCRLMFPKPNPADRVDLPNDVREPVASKNALLH